MFSLSFKVYSKTFKLVKYIPILPTTNKTSNTGIFVAFCVSDLFKVISVTFFLYHMLM